MRCQNQSCTRPAYPAHAITGATCHPLSDAPFFPAACVHPTLMALLCHILGTTPQWRAVAGTFAPPPELEIRCELAQVWRQGRVMPSAILSCNNHACGWDGGRLLSELLMTRGKTVALPCMLEYFILMASVMSYVLCMTNIRKDHYSDCCIVYLEIDNLPVVFQPSDELFQSATDCGSLPRSS
ncbi:hypothetical protein NFI96_021414 [Prochilodus magdalenae]|nr:hypothetical protein NFI96_021414 [Prochilodus magdalenae]